MVLRIVNRLVFVAILSALVPWASAQSSGQPGKSGSSGSGGDKTKPAAPMPQTDNQRPPRLNPQILFLTGSVVDSDGSPLPLGVTIVRTCGGRIKREATVDSNGYFSFQVGGPYSDPGVLPEASDDTFAGLDPMGGRGSQRFGGGSGMDLASPSGLMGCELSAQLPGYRSSSIVLDNPHMSGTMDVGTLVLHPITKVQGSTISATSLAAPKAAKKALEHANHALEKKNLVEAEQYLKTSVEAYPNYAEAWYRLGQIYQEQKRNPDARAAYGKAIAADAKFVNPYVKLAQISFVEQNWQEVANLTDRAIEMDPLDFPEGFFFNSIAYYTLNKLDLAEKSVRKAQLLDSRHRIPQTHLVLADILQQKGDVTGAIEQLQNYLKLVPNGTRTDQIQARLEKLHASQNMPDRVAKSPEN